MTTHVDAAHTFYQVVFGWEHNIGGPCQAFAVFGKGETPGHRMEGDSVWLALDRDSGEIVGVALGKQDGATARQLRESLPALYRQCAVCYTDFWEAYAAVLPSKRHRASGKGSGQTSRIERINNTLRQHLSGLVRKTLSFSKKQTSPDGAIWYYIHHHNATRAARRAPGVRLT